MFHSCKSTHTKVHSIIVRGMSLQQASAGQAFKVDAMVA